MGATLQVQFGKRIQQLRKAAKLTQEQLAKRAGLDYKYLGSLERGERNVTIANIEKVVKGLGVQPYEPFVFGVTGEGRGDVSEDILMNLIRHSDPTDRQLLINLIRTVLARPKPKK